jgi:hypothetical protein
MIYFFCLAIATPSMRGGLVLVVKKTGWVYYNYLALSPAFISHENLLQ